MQQNIRNKIEQQIKFDATTHYIFKQKTERNQYLLCTSML